MNYPRIAHGLAMSFLVYLPLRAFSQFDQDSILMTEPLIDITREDQAERIGEYLAEEQPPYLDLNTATETEIRSFILFTPAEAESIIGYLHRHRPLHSALELQTIGGIPIEKLKNWLPYLQSSGPGQRKHTTIVYPSSLQLRWSQTLQQAMDYISADSSKANYTGSPDQLLFRWKHHKPHRYSLVVTAEKDAGESLLIPAAATGVDYLSASLALENLLSKMPLLILGDYSLRLGQGLLVDNGFSAVQAAGLGSRIKNPGEFQPWQSLRETELLRGLATRIHWNRHWTQIAFMSAVRRDANLVESQDPGSGQASQHISALQNSGVHRSKSEVEDRHATDFLLAGQSIEYRNGRSHMGFNLLYKKQAHAYLLESRPDRAYIPVARNQWSASLHQSLNWRNLLLAGEFAVDQRGSHAAIQHLLLGLGKKAEALISWWNFHPGFYQEYSQTLSSSGLSWNESGLTLAMNLMPSSKFFLQGSIDFSMQPWLKYNATMTANDREIHFLLHCKLRKKQKLELRWKRKIANDDIIYSGDPRLTTKYFQQRDQLRLQFETALNDEWTWRSRIEIHKTRAIDNPGTGLLICQDLICKSIGSSWSGSFRFAVFDVSTTDARIYSFENDLRGQFSIPAYNGRGIRVLANLSCRAVSSLHIGLRLSDSFYFDAMQNASFDSHHRTEVKIALYYSY